MFVLSVVLLYCFQAGTTAAPSENLDYASLIERGRVASRNGHFAASEAAFLAALRILDRADEMQRASTLSELGDVYANTDEISKAERAYLESREIYSRLSYPRGAALILRNLGALYSLQRRYDEALKVLQQALKLVKANPDVSHDLLARILNAFGVVYLRQGNLGKGESFMNQALKAASDSGDSIQTPQVLHNLGAVYYEKRDFKKAENFFKQSLQMTEVEVGPDHPDLTFGLTSLGHVYINLGNYAEAEKQYQRALQIMEPNKSLFDTRIARVLHGLSRMFTKAGRHAEAEAALSQAAAIARRNLAEHEDMAVILEDYSLALKHQGKPKEAEELRGEARRARVAAGLVINAHTPF
jgi:tetratricopeptide (TPR) repeat protein